MSTKASQEKTVVLEPIEIQRLNVTITGDAPLVTHKWSAKARKQMLDKQMKQAKQAKEAKDPAADFNEARYITEDGRDGFPSSGIKKSIMSAFRYADGIKKVEIAGALHVEPSKELVPIDGPAPTMREDMVRVGMTTDIRYRPEYVGWSMTFDVVYNARAISAEQIVGLVNIAGFGVGIGENRPEKGGSWGMFHVG